MSKILVSMIALSTLGAAGAFASDGDFKLPRGSKALYAVEGQVERIVMDFGNCPPNAMCQPAFVAEVNFPLGGCVDSLGPVTVQFDSKDDGTTDVYVTAIAVANKMSELTRCIRQPVARERIYLPGGASKENTRFHFVTSL